MTGGAARERARLTTPRSAPACGSSSTSLSASPVPDPEVEETRERIVLRGDLPSPAAVPPGCRFHTRCPWVQPTRCRDEVPPLRDVRPGHAAACHWAEEIAAGALRPLDAAAAVTGRTLPVPP